MASGKFYQDRSIKRRSPHRQPKTRILIVCEGRVTERQYFKAFQHQVRNPRVHVEVSKETGVPLTVVQCAVRLRNEAISEAKRERDENLLWDQVWGVFDVDEHPNLDKAVDLAESEGIQLAISNPSFELWALLHFQEQRAFASRQQVRASLKTYLPDYEKLLDFEVMHPHYAEALRRAQELDHDAGVHGASGRNPATGVHRLTQTIVTTA
jgi:hypothetical protein